MLYIICMEYFIMFINVHYNHLLLNFKPYLDI